MWQILVKKLAVPNLKTGGARQAAVATQPMDVWKYCQRKSGSPYPDFSNESTFLWVQAILKAEEARKVKLSCFKGIVHPTHFQKQVGWGTWLDHTYLKLSLVHSPALVMNASHNFSNASLSLKLQRHIALSFID